MPAGRTFSILIGSVFIAFVLLTAFHAGEHGRRVHRIIRDRELPSIGTAVKANLDRTSADLLSIGEELLRDNFVRDWILDGENDEDLLREFLEPIQVTFEMLDTSVVSDRSETYYGTDGRTLRLSPDNALRDGWYYSYRHSRPPSNIDIWYYPDTNALGMWLNVSILDDAGKFLGIAGGRIDSRTFAETMNVYGDLEGISVYLARPDGQLVYATDKTLLAHPTSHVNHLWGEYALDALTPLIRNPAPRVIHLPCVDGCILWGTFAQEWDALLVVEKAGEIVTERTREAVMSSLVPSGFLTVSLFLITLSTIVFARNRVTRQSAELERLAGTDPVTGLYNRLRFDDFVKHEVARIRRTGEESSLIILDLDYFKLVNDTFGHPAGDAVLRSVGEVLKGHVRAADTVARFGGEEFTILLPGTTVSGASTLAEHIRKAIEKCSFPQHSSDLRVTASFGVAPLTHSETTAFHEAYREADRALYEAKRAGRNRVYSAGSIDI